MSVEVYPNIYNVEVYDSVVYVPTALSLLKVSEDTEASANKAYVADTGVGALILSLPLTAKLGDSVEVVRFGAGALTIDRNGHKINGLDQDLLPGDQVGVRLRYVDSTIGWIQF